MKMGNNEKFNRRALFGAALASAAVLPLRGSVTTPRQSPDFNMLYLSAAPKKLSSYRGTVCLVEFMFTTCQHCQHAAGMFSKLQNEFGPKGFQALGIAFNPMAHMLVPDFQRDFKPNFPIAYSERDPVLQFLGISAIERYVVPQVVLIDRAGMIRHQSAPTGTVELQDEAFLRKEIAAMLAAPMPKPAVPARVPAARLTGAR